MDTNDTHHTWAAVALTAFLRRTLTQLAVAAERDAKQLRAALKALS